MFEKTISQHLKKLKEKLWISRQRRYNKSYKYDLDGLARRVAWLAGAQTILGSVIHPIRLHTRKY